MPVTSLHFDIYRGLRFKGFRGIALDAAGSPVVFNEGTTAQLQARRAPGKPVAFSLDVSLGESDGEVIIDPIDAADTIELPLGVYQFALIITDTESEPTGPHTKGVITINPAPLDS